jgi:DNA-directed RNA polymerase specialized sigma24 family protein
MNPWDSFNRCVGAAFRVCRDEDTARDIATEVCGSLDQFFIDGGGNTVHATPAMLATKATWRALDHLRKGKVEVVRGYDIERAIDDAPGPEQILEAKQTRKALEARLGEVEMFVIDRTSDGYSSAEIGVKLNKSAVAVDHIRSRARRKLLSGE